MVRFLIWVGLWLGGSICVAQSVHKQQAIAKRMWGTPSPDFTQTQVNENWKGYSVVVLAKSIELEELNSHGPYVHENLYIHQRIKLTDRAAVNQYSEITFDDDEFFTTPTNAMVWNTDLFIGFKVIKPSGEERIIPLTDAVVMEIKSGLKRHDYKKLAIPDLEPGDILDYYIVQLSATQVDIRTEVSLMTPIYYSLASELPIQKHSIKVWLSPIFGFSYKSLNGAPELVREKGNTIYNRVFTLQDTNRAPVPEMRWTHEHRVMPLVKFQASYNHEPTAEGVSALAGPPGSNRTGFTEPDYTRFMKNFRGKPTKATKTVGAALDTHMRLYFTNEVKSEVLAREAYYFIRQYIYVESHDKLAMHNLAADNRLSGWEFASIMSGYLKKRQIKHDVLLTTRNYLSDLTDAVLPDELDMLIRINTPTPIYLASPERYTLFGELPYYFHGNYALAMNGLTKTDEGTVVPVTVPVSASPENTEQIAVKLSFMPDNLFRTTLTRKLTYTGLNRNKVTGLVVTSSDYISQARRKKFWTGIAEGSGKAITLQQKELEEKLRQFFVEEKEARETALKKHLEETLDAKVISIDSVKVEQVGTWHDQRELKFRDSYTLEGLVTQAGPNLLLNAGMLSGDQLELKKQDLTRNFPWAINHPATYTSTITVNLPEGYNLKGLEKLHYNVTNKMGGFVSTAALNGNSLTITTTEHFQYQTGNAADWPLMVDVLQAAYDFSQQKLLLQKQSPGTN